MLLLLFHVSYGQQAVVPSGGNAATSSGSVSYSIGQIDYTTNSSSAYSVAAGVQQPFEISVLTVDETILDHQLSVFPNPTVDALILDIAKLEIDNLSYVVFDTNGKLLSQQKITAQHTTIDFAQLPNSIYFIKVESQGKNLKTFKIIKK